MKIFNVILIKPLKTKQLCIQLKAEINKGIFKASHAEMFLSLSNTGDSVQIILIKANDNLDYNFPRVSVGN